MFFPFVGEETTRSASGRGICEPNLSSAERLPVRSICSTDEETEAHGGGVPGPRS